MGSIQDGIIDYVGRVRQVRADIPVHTNSSSYGSVEDNHPMLHPLLAEALTKRVHAM